MSILYVHLSDIHFGQEKGGDLFINNDVKEQLLADAHNYVGLHTNGKAAGVIISGDIAYAGKQHEYDEAGEWLDKLTTAVGCEVTAVQVVPGNHDIDREKITEVSQLIIDKIIEGGDDALDKLLEQEADRDILYKQFSAYRTFAEGYDCPLDSDGKVAGHRIIEIAPGRKIKFHGINTALICSKSKSERGGLLLGKRQRVLPKEPGTELIIIAHHPLHWMQDSEDAMRYIRNRARIFISGHEHQPSHSCEKLDDSTDLLSLASGATVPPGANDEFNYCYNILEFEWDAEVDGLIVTIHGRIWDNETKAFVSDNKHFNKGIVKYNLNCPNFKMIPIEINSNATQIDNNRANLNTEFTESIQYNKEDKIVEDKKYQIVLLRFFRDLSASQRLSVLVELGAIPNDWQDALTHSLERKALDQLVEQNKIDILQQKITEIIANSN